MTSEIRMAVRIKIAVVWYVTFHPEDVGSKFLRNVGIYQTTLLHIPENSNQFIQEI
jgi:hypothetical protein